jgi:hypothetical protein
LICSCLNKNAPRREARPQKENEIGKARAANENAWLPKAEKKFLTGAGKPNRGLVIVD